jgi:hypothetical protein
MVELKPENIGELKQVHRWVRGARCDVLNNKGELRKDCKPPFDAKTGRYAKPNDFSTWCDFKTVIAAHEKDDPPLFKEANIVTMHPERYIGVVAGKPFLFGDCDDCRNPETGEINAQGQAMIQLWNTRTEVSPSGTGLRFVGHGEAPDAKGRNTIVNGCKIEFYSAGHWLTITGNVLPGYEEIRRMSPAEVTKIYDAHRKGKQTVLSPPTNQKLEALLAGDIEAAGYTDRSEADFNLCWSLAKKGLSREMVEAIWMKSGLRDDGKLDRADYRHMTLDAAFQGIVEGPETEMELAVSDADKAEVKKTTWLWKGWLSRGDVHGSFGDSKEGKSPVWTDIAAILTTGRAFPDGVANENGPVNVILCNSEDSFERKTLPRFLAAGGDATRLKHIEGVRPKGSSLRARVLALDQSTELIREYLQRQKEQGAEFALLVFDPITSFLGKMKYTDHQQTRRVMDPLADLAEQFKLAVVIVNHFNRNTETTSAQYRTLGGGLYQVCRQVLLHTRPEDADVTNGDERYRHVLSEDRNQEVDSIEYSTVKKLLSLNGDEFDVIQIVWGKKIEAKSDAMMDQTSNQDKGLYAKLAAELEKYLLGKRDGDSASSCVAYLETCFPEIKGRKEFHWEKVRKKAGIVTGKDGKASRWRLPQEANAGNLFGPTPERLKRAEEIKKDNPPEY